MNGFIDYTEFLAGCMKSKIYLQEDFLKSAFSYFDKVKLLKILSANPNFQDNSGTITLDELK